MITNTQVSKTISENGKGLSDLVETGRYLRAASHESLCDGDFG